MMLGTSRRRFFSSWQEQIGWHRLRLSTLFIFLLWPAFILTHTCQQDQFPALQSISLIECPHSNVAIWQVNELSHTSLNIIKLESSNMENSIKILCQLFARLFTNMKQWIIHNCGGWRTTNRKHLKLRTRVDLVLESGGLRAQNVPLCRH